MSKTGLGFGSGVPLVGLSLGGWMAAELATRYPERVSKLVLVNPVGLYIEGQPVKEIFGRTPAELAEDMFADQSHPMAQMMHMLSEFRGDVGQQIEVPMELVLPIWKSMSATAKLGWDPYLHNPKLRRRLHRVTAPTLVIHGAQDTLAPKAISEAYAADIPDARLVDVEGGAHLVILEKPDEMAQFVLGWDMDRIHEAMNNGPNNATITLKHPIPVFDVEEHSEAVALAIGQVMIYFDTNIWARAGDVLGAAALTAAQGGQAPL